MNEPVGGQPPADSDAHAGQPPDKPTVGWVSRVEAVSKVVGLVSGVAGLLILLKGKYDAAAVALGLIGLCLALYFSVRMGFSRISGREVTPAWLRWVARAGLVVVLATAVFLVCFPPTQQFACRALGIAFCATAPETLPLSQFGVFTYSDPQGLCAVRVQPAPDPDLGSVTQIVYDPGTAGASYCGWGFRLEGYDASDQASVTFWLRGTTGDEAFTVRLSDSGTAPEGEAAVDVRQSRTHWHQVSIPLSRFQGQDRTALDCLTLAFDNDTGPGTIYVTDFRFEAGRP